MLLAEGAGTAMGMKASEVGDWLRQTAGKRDHRQLMPEDRVAPRRNSFDVRAVGVRSLTTLARGLWARGMPAPHSDMFAPGCKAVLIGSSPMSR